MKWPSTGAESGSVLVEALVALGLLGLLGIALFSALITASRTAATNDRMVAMNSLARAEMEYVKNSPYVSGSPDVTTYPVVGSGEGQVTVPSGYSITVLGHALDQPDDGIQEITVTVSAGSANLVLNGYKVNR